MARVLVAEDEPLLRWSLEMTLRRDGHAVSSVNSGAAAIEAAGAGGYRVVILDYGTSGPTGPQVLRQIKTRSPEAHVIVITDQAIPRMERLSRDIGAFDFLEKPFQFAALRHAVARAILTPERRKGPRGCCGGCAWERPCGGPWSPQGLREAS